MDFPYSLIHLDSVICKPEVPRFYWYKPEDLFETPAAQADHDSQQIWQYESYDSEQAWYEVRPIMCHST